jgi:hypothetical protein
MTSRTPLAVFVVLLAAPWTGAANKADGPSYRVAASRAAAEDLLAGLPGAWEGAATIGWGPVPYETRFRAVWDATGLYLRFDASDANPWHTMTRRDEHLWEEEVVEIFLDVDRSGRDYYELEISPANVVCDVRMVSPSPDKKMDLAWDLEGLVTHARTETDATGKVTGWTATAFLPWAGFKALPSARGGSLPPRAGDAWRFNVFRIDRPGGKAAPEKDAVEVAWSRPSGESFHEPSVFRDFVFDGPR